MDKECMHINLMNTTFAESGYDIPVFGVGHYCFNVIHVTAIVCLLLSLCSAVVVIILLYKSKVGKPFMKWHKHERFLLYRCICDTSYGFVHSLDHTQILITKDHVRPSGLCSFCAFDSVKGVIANIIVSTGMIGAILVALSTLYVFTWYRIYTESKKLKTNLGNNGSLRSATLKSAKAMCLFVVVYIIQWTPVTVYGTWQLISDVPFGLFLAVVIMTNLSGVFSGAIWLFNMSNKNSVSNQGHGETNLDMTASKGRSTCYTDQSSTNKQ
ncbi:uncharacterized protein LOC127721157 [Mytilus californianus]|uniref:uncharacterized protein LOC127721157 n=1 Tax=Mytilus californianus TaxID=6549 RepID=UPI0022472838|nr:uncharacterized protein LOC127721157 [Mytilus californianus]